MNSVMKAGRLLVCACLLSACLLNACLLSISTALAEPAPSAQQAVTVVDILGREVTLKQPAQKVVLGEGRFMAMFGVLGLAQPTSFVAGMMNEFRVYDPSGFAEYRRVFPEIEQIPTFGHTSEDSVSLEKLVLSMPDVAIFGLGGHGPSARSKHIVERLEQAGIPVVFIDFRKAPIAHTARSLEIVASLLGHADKGKAVAKRYQERIQLIRKRVAAIPMAQRPKVLFDLRVDNSQTCCFSVASGLFAAMAELAGARNIATEVLNAPVGKLSKEYILTADIDVYIGTATGSADEASSHKERAQHRYNRLIAGRAVSEAQAQKALRQVLEKRGLVAMPAVEAGRAYVLWHHFYNSPLNLYAIEKMASWFHPEHFADLKPEQTLENLLAGFAPLELAGSYGAQIDRPD